MQVPDVEKRRRADFIVDSSQSFDHARAQVRDIVVPAAILVGCFRRTAGVENES
jgi:dephospho-CoA kinase